MNRFLPHLLAGAMVVGLLGSTGCVARAGYVTPVGPAVTVSTASPSLAMVGPNVWVVQGYDEPVFYADDGYWLYRNNVWYRSHAYNGGWVRSFYVPVGIRTHIRYPYRYRRYRARRGIRVRRAFRVNRRAYRTRYRHPRYNRRVYRNNRRVYRDNRRLRRNNRRVIRNNRRVIRNNRRIHRDNRRMTRDNRRLRRDNRRIRRDNRRVKRNTRRVKRNERRRDRVRRVRKKKRD